MLEQKVWYHFNSFICSDEYNINYVLTTPFFILIGYLGLFSILEYS